LFFVQLRIALIHSVKWKESMLYSSFNSFDAEI